MSKRNILFAAIFAAAAVFASCQKTSNTGEGHADHPHGNMESMEPESPASAVNSKEAYTPNTTCPVMEGNPINRNLFVEHDGKKIYVCCPACIDTVKQDPEKYLAKIKAQQKTDSE